MNQIRILIAEDHETVREGLKLIVESQDDMKVIGEARNGRQAVTLAQKLQPDIVLMDVSMPELNGLIATENIKQIDPEIKILTLTRHSDEAYLQELLRAGVSGYLLKQSPTTELLRAIRLIHAGDNYLDSSIAGKALGTISGNSDKYRGETRGMPLTEREKETLRQIALGFSNREIAECMNISVKTVEAHKANAQLKLGISRRYDIIRYAILQGWLKED